MLLRILAPDASINKLTCQYGRRSKGKNRREDDVSKVHISFIYALLKTNPCATGRNAIGGMCWREFAVLSVAADLRG